jgi:GGDEF domain-containing protein
VVSWRVTHRAAAPVLAGFPYIVLAAGLFLGFRFGRGRLLLGLLVLVASAAATALRLPEPPVVISLLLPLNLTAAAFLPDRGPSSRAIRTWAIVVLAQVLVAAALVRLAPRPLAHALLQPLLPIDALDRSPVGQIPLVAFLLALGVTGYRVSMRGEASARGLFWAAATSLLALLAGGRNELLYFSTGGLALVIAMVEASHALAFRDDLTGLPGRRALNQALAAVDGRYIIAMVDVDHFKQFNDRHGHDVGDQVLKLVANRLAMMGAGTAYRYGGEEFAVVFTGSDPELAAAHLQSLRRNVEDATFTLRGRDRPKNGDPTRRGQSPRRRDISVTISIGAAKAGADQKEPAAVVKAADQALYRAKDRGRNRVEVDW